MPPVESGQLLATNRPLIIQGPVGTVLGQEQLPSSLHMLLDTAGGPEALFRIHDSYAGAGASFLVAHTFGAQEGRDPMLRASNRKQTANIEEGVRIAADAARLAGIPVAASISPVGDCYKPAEGLQLSYDELVARQRKMIRIVTSGGAKFAVAETYSNWYEIQAFSEAAAEEGVDYGLSLYVERSDEDGLLHLPYDRLRQPEEETEGPLLSEAVSRLASLPKKPSFVGANCIPLEYAIEAVSDIIGSADGIVASIWANGDGIPNNTPAELLAQRARQGKELLVPTLRQCIIGGAAIIGGCCRTDHVDTAVLNAMVQGGVLLS